MKITQEQYAVLRVKDTNLDDQCFQIFLILLAEAMKMWIPLPVILLFLLASTAAVSVDAVQSVEDTLRFRNGTQISSTLRKQKQAHRVKPLFIDEENPKGDKTNKIVHENTTHILSKAPSYGTAFPAFNDTAKTMDLLSRSKNWHMQANEENNGTRSDHECLCCITRVQRFAP